MASPNALYGGLASLYQSREAERASSVEMWVGVQREARHGKHYDSDKPIHLHRDDLVIFVVVLERPVVVTGNEEIRQWRGQLDLAGVLFCIVLDCPWVARDLRSPAIHESRGTSTTTG